MVQELTFDVFYSQSDMTVVRPLAERLRRDDLKLWFDERVLKPAKQDTSDREASKSDGR
jgi:hypothetical protein